MNALKKKLNKNGGFTLVEMLIVVAIIAILIAVSIPLVNNALERARLATDAANVRSAKAEITIEYLTDADFATGNVWAFDAGEGILKADPTGIKAYGKASGNTSNIIYITMKDDVVYYQWREPNNAPGPNLNTGRWKTAIDIVE